MLTLGRYHHPRKPPSLRSHLISEVVHTWKISLSRIHGVNHRNTAVLYYTKLAPAQNPTRASFRSNGSSFRRPWIPISSRANFAAEPVMPAFFCFLVSIFFPFPKCLFPWQGGERSILLNDHWGKGSFLSSTLFRVVGFVQFNALPFFLTVTLISASENKLLLKWVVCRSCLEARPRWWCCMWLMREGTMAESEFVLGWDGMGWKGRRWTDGQMETIMSVVKRKHKLMRK